jgi:hypothetical protein
MSTIANINGIDLITDSRADINNNFSALNADKVETSVIDDDSTLSANSSSRIPTQRAVKAYTDSGGNVNATETTKGIVEIATQAEVDAGTATGATGASLVVTPETFAASAALSTAPVVNVYEVGDSPATWTKPTGLKYVVVKVQGGGGTSASDAGGGGGGYSEKLIAAASLGATETVTIGAAAGNSSFGTHAVGNAGSGATGGTATSGDINIPGQDGQGASSTGGSVSRTYAEHGGDSMLGFGGRRGGGAAKGYGGGGFDGAGTAGVVIVTEYYV